MDLSRHRVRSLVGQTISSRTRSCGVTSNKIAASFDVINKPCATPRLIIHDMLVYPSLDMAGGLYVLIEEAAASLDTGA